MPLPLIPIAIGTSILVSGVTGLVVKSKADKRKKQAKEAYENRYGAYKAKHHHGEQKCEDVREKFAELSFVRLEAYRTLGNAASFLKNSKLGKQGKAEQFGFTLEHLDHLKRRSGVAADALGALGGLGVGAAGVSAAWTAAGFGAASTGAAISGLSGAAATSAKLAFLGGGALTAGGGGMALGTMALGGLPIGPALLAMGFASQLDANKFEAAVQEEIDKIDNKECKLDDLTEKANLVDLRITELVEATKQVDHVLRQLLSQCSPQNPSDVKAVASMTNGLAQIVDIAILDEEDAILNKETLDDVYRPHLIETRKRDLSQGYNLMRESVATLDYKRLDSAFKHIIRIVVV